MSKLTHAALAHFTGGLERFRHSLNRRVIYTDGVQFVAEHGGAYWLLDEIALHLGSRPFQQSAAHDPRLQHMAFWTLTVKEDRTARLIGYADTGETPFFEKSIPFTDFPLDEISIWSAWDGVHWTLYLPSEH